MGRMARLIRMDHTGHTTLAEWSTDDPAAVERAVAAFRDQLDAGLYAVVSAGEGEARQVRELPLDAELVILSEQLASPEAAKAIAERVLEALRAPIVLRDETVTLSASIGISVAMEAGATRDGMLRAADSAMYSAKAAGPGRFVVAE